LASQTPDSIHQDSSEVTVAAREHDLNDSSLPNTTSFAKEFSLAELPSEDSLPPLFPTPKRTGISKWLWLGLVVSLGLHTFLLLLPTGNEPPPTPPKDPDKQVRITQLPKLIKTAPAPKKVVKPAIKQVTRPQTTPAIAEPKTPPKREAPSNPETSGSNAWDDFPIYPGSQAGCFNLSSCQQTGDGVSQVAAFYTKELPAKK
jgi:hypothetical protein